jgi:glucose-6-phosphate-specific signal transduction histidine kinase
MSVSTPPPWPRPAQPVFSWKRLRFAAALGGFWALLLSIMSDTSLLAWLARGVGTVSLAVLAYGACGRWPATLPPWMARWVWQLLAVVVAVPLGACVAYMLTAPWPFWAERRRLLSWLAMSFLGILVGPWLALAAMVRDREALARTQALAFDLERSELERQALDARLRLMQSQVQPHFLFNTLANVLVGSGSPQAAQVLDSLIAYLRAAVPRLNDPLVTLAEELALVRAYLDLMQMRMPDRLQFSVQVDPAALPQRCPPTTLLTLVENAVRHGIDPSEDGGRIDVRASVRDGRCRIEVADTGLGLGVSNPGLGTGLTMLRERLELTFAGRAQLHLQAGAQRGVQAVVDLPLDTDSTTPPGR